MLSQVIECHGGIHYKIEHMNKARWLERLGLLPQSIWVMDAATDCWDGNNEGPETSDNGEESVVER
jgi:hypothetical protein